MRIRTTPQTETTVRDALQALTGQSEGRGPVHKWHVLRIALMLSLRESEVPAFQREVYEVGGFSGGGDYRLKELTGEGKNAQEDYTHAVRAMLGVLHDRDLYHPAEGEDDFGLLLTWHLERGARLLGESWRKGQDLYGVLFGLVSESATAADPVVPARDLEPIRRALRDLGVQGEVSDTVEQGPRLDCVRIALASAGEMDLLRGSLEKLAFSLGEAENTFSVEPGDEPRMAHLYIARPRSTWKVPGNADLERWCDEAQDSFTLPMCPGTDVRGTPIWFDLSKAPHLLVAGATGSGKSVCMHSLLRSLMRRKTDDVFRLCLLDPKKVELVAYGKSSYLWDQVGLTSELPDMVDALRQLEVEMDARYSAFEQLGVRDLGELRKQGQSLPYLVVVVDELADLVLQEKGAEKSLVRLAQKGRAAGVHLLLSTQRPDAKTFSGLLRSNVDSRIALAVQSASNSKIVLDQAGAERLLKPGDGFFADSASQKPQRLHCPLVAAS